MSCGWGSFIRRQTILSLMAFAIVRCLEAKQYFTGDDGGPGGAAFQDFLDCVEQAAGWCFFQEIAVGPCAETLEGLVVVFRR